MGKVKDPYSGKEGRVCEEKASQCLSRRENA